MISQIINKLSIGSIGREDLMSYLFQIYEVTHDAVIHNLYSFIATKNSLTHKDNILIFDILKKRSKRIDIVAINKQFSDQKKIIKNIHKQEENEIFNQ